MQRHLVTFFAAGFLPVVVSSYMAAQSAGPEVKQYHPFTAKMETTYIDDDGGETRFRKSFFRKSNGSYAEIKGTEAVGERGTRQNILDPATRSYATVDSFTKSVLVLFLPDEWEFRSFQQLVGTCRWLADGTWKRVGQSERLGIHVIEVEESKTENLKKKLWVAPDLDCFPLLDLLIEKGEVRTKEEVLSLEFGEPDPGAFRVPSGSVYVNPLQFEERWKKRFNGQSYYGDPQLAEKVERRFQDAKARSSRPAPIK